MKRERMKKDNKGFSLVELIIVISIMAILIGVVGTQVIPYLEKSRQANDNQIVSTIGTAAVSAFASQAGKLTAGANYVIEVHSTQAWTAASIKRGATALTSTDKDYAVLTDLIGYMGMESADVPINGKLVPRMDSKLGKTLQGLTINYDGTTGVVTVQCYSDTTFNASNKILETVVSK